MVRPLRKGELGIQGNQGEWLIYDEKTGNATPEIPQGLQLARVPLLVSISDQGPNNMAALNYLQYSSESLMIHAQWDPFHRAWNDLKQGMKKCSWQAWKVVLQLTVVANLPYGPFESGTWFYKKQARLKEYLDAKTIHSSSWREFQHLICLEQRRAEPRNDEEAQELLHSLKHLPSFMEKGPLVKLMRWFSFFESMMFMDGQFWFTKLILSDTSLGGPEEEE